MKYYFLTITILCFTLLITSCSEQSPKNVDFEKEKNEILALHHAQREYHFENKPEDFVNKMTDEFISVNGGLITTPHKDSLIARFGGYFSSVDFIRWDDFHEPIVRISNDASMAYTVVDKIVELSYPTPDGNTLKDTTRFAWTAVYRKIDGKWKIDNVTSTDTR